MDLKRQMAKWPKRLNELKSIFIDAFTNFRNNKYHSNALVKNF